MQRILIPPKQPGETINQNFDFSSLVPAGFSILSALVTCQVVNGIDPAPGSMIVFFNTISGNVVTQQIVGGVTGVTYFLTCTATLDSGAVISLGGYLAVIGVLS